MGKTQDPRFAQTMFVVEADSFARHELWVRFSRESNEAGYGLKRPPTRLHDWRQDTSGLCLTIGKLDKRPINIECFWAIIAGCRVLFYSGISQVVDHAMIETWLKKHCNPTWDEGRRRAHCNAMNFHHRLNAIDDLIA